MALCEHHILLKSSLCYYSQAGTAGLMGSNKSGNDTHRMKTLPSSETFKNGVATFEDMEHFTGGEPTETIGHFYKVSNLGPQTIGGVELRVAWPTEDGEGRTCVVMISNSSLIRIDIGIIKIS